MRSELKCIPCVIRQLERSAGFLNLHEDKINFYIRKAIKKLEELSLELPPNLFTTKILEVLYEDIQEDPYKEIKKKQNENVKGVLPFLEEKIKNSAEPLYSAILFSSLGNIIDLGPQDRYDFDSLLERKKRFDYDDFDIFLKKIKKGGRLLYILDNSGEAVIDKMVLGMLEKYFDDYRIVARGKPILNDITVKEAEELDFNKEKLISTGVRVLGIDFQHAPEELKKWYRDADVVIGKGHANFESLIDGKRDAFLILQIKCEVVGRYIGLEKGSSVLFYYHP